jgi:hypothetical protein
LNVLPQEVKATCSETGKRIEPGAEMHRDESHTVIFTMIWFFVED